MGGLFHCMPLSDDNKGPLNMSAAMNPASGRPRQRIFTSQPYHGIGGIAVGIG
jgi:hypothetical protein